MSKNTKKEQTGIFTIEFESHDSSEIPGIAELLGSKSSKPKKDAPKQITSANDDTSPVIQVKFNKNAASPSGEVKSLKEFETVLEVHFQLKGDQYVYTEHQALTAQQNFLGYHSLFDKMKIPTRLVQEFGTFGEFQSQDKTYLFDAFGISDQHYLQFVLNQSNQVLSVYVSDKSMLTRKDQVMAYAESHNSKYAPDQKIELDLAS